MPSRLNASLFYYVAIAIFFVWYAQRRRAEVIRQKQMQRENPEDYPRAGQARDRTPLAVLAVIMVIAFALAAWQRQR